MVGKKDRDALEKILGEADDLYVDALAVAKRRERRLTRRVAAGDDRAGLGGHGVSGGDVTFIRHPIERVVAPP